MHYSYEAQCRCRHVGSLFILQAFAALQRAFSILRISILEAQSGLLEFDTVSTASCSEPADADRILGLIRGYEEQIDTAINCLKVVGRYNAHIERSLILGLP